MKLFNYFDFLFEGAESPREIAKMKIYYSDRFRDLLTKIASNKSTDNETPRMIAEFLLTGEDSNQALDIYTLIDATDKNDKISFVQVNRILRKYPEMEIDKELFTKGDYIKINGLIGLLQNLTQTEETFSFEEPLYYGLANKDNINIITLEIEY